MMGMNESKILGQYPSNTFWALRILWVKLTRYARSKTRLVIIRLE